MFLPSYGLLDRLKDRWTESGLLAHITDRLSIGVWFEPREGKAMDVCMDNYYSDIDNGNRAVLVAVCRGKVSEGINFSDQVYLSFVDCREIISDVYSVLQVGDCIRHSFS